MSLFKFVSLLFVIVIPLHFSFANDQVEYVQKIEAEIAKGKKIVLANAGSIDSLRREFEDSTLNYLESFLSSYDPRFGYEESEKRVRIMLSLEYVEYPYRAKVLKCIAMMRKVPSSNSDDVMKCLEEIAEQRKEEDNEIQFRLVMKSLISYRYFCGKSKGSSPQFLDQLDSFIEKYSEEKE